MNKDSQKGRRANIKTFFRIVLEKMTLPKAVGFFIPFIFFITLPSTTHSAEPIRIGLLLPPRETNTHSGKSYLKGAEMAVAEVNSREGKQGIQLILALREGSYKEGKTLNELREFLWEERIHSLGGIVPPEAILPVSLLAQEQRVPFLVFPLDFMGAASTGAEPPNLFWISPAPEAFQRAAVRTAAQFRKKRFFLLARDTNAGRNLVKYFWEELKRLKPDAQRIGELFLPEKVEDYGMYTRAVTSSGAEVCLSHLGPKEWIRLARTAKKQGYFKKITHFEMESGNLESLVALGKEAPEGVWGISAFPFWALGWNEAKEFVAKYKEKTNSYPGLDALSGYVSIYALVEGMKKAGSLGTERFLGTLEGLSFRTPIGILAIRKADHRVLWPIWCGVSKFSSGYPFAILEDLQAFGPDSFLPPSPQGEKPGSKPAPATQ